MTVKTGEPPFLQSRAGVARNFCGELDVAFI